MLNFVPMNNKSIAYTQTEELDSWGQPLFIELFRGKCQISYNMDLTTISGADGSTTSLSATVLYKGFLNIHAGDLVEFSTANGITNKYQVIDVFFFEDYVGKIMNTRVVVGNGKRS